MLLGAMTLVVVQRATAVAAGAAMGVVVVVGDTGRLVATGRALTLLLHTAWCVHGMISNHFVAADASSLRNGGAACTRCCTAQQCNAESNACLLRRARLLSSAECPLVSVEQCHEPAHMPWYIIFLGVWCLVLCMSYVLCCAVRCRDGRPGGGYGGGGGGSGSYERRGGGYGGVLRL